MRDFKWSCDGCDRQGYSAIRMTIVKCFVCGGQMSCEERCWDEGYLTVMEEVCL